MPQTNEGVSVPYGAILDQLHQRYGRTIAQLMQENAELQAAMDSQAGELQEFKARFQAMAQSATGNAPDGSAWSGSGVAEGLLGSMTPAGASLFQPLDSGGQAGAEQDGHPEGQGDQAERNI